MNLLVSSVLWAPAEDKFRRRWKWEELGPSVLWKLKKIKKVRMNFWKGFPPLALIWEFNLFFFANDYPSSEEIPRDFYAIAFLRLQHEHVSWLSLYFKKWLIQISCTICFPLETCVCLLLPFYIRSTEIFTPITIPWN